MRPYFEVRSPKVSQKPHPFRQFARRLVASFTGNTAKQTPPDWFNKSPEKDGVEGMSVDLAYDKFQLKTRSDDSPVIVAVIDSGGDVTHEDMRGAVGPEGKPVDPAHDRIWINVSEGVPGQDGDGNGLENDYNGWSFLGTSNDASLEVAREELRLRDLEKQRPLTPEEQVYREAVLKVLTKAPNPRKLLDEAVSGAKSRQETLGDDVNNYQQRHYGNNDVTGPDAKHGTHVGGSVGAIRINDRGIQGVASNVKVIHIRVVSQGDEYDKDVANGLRLAADYGADIVNMSFGKQFSPGRVEVQDAALYAASKDVLMVHAAGNDGMNLDTEGQFRAPTRAVERAPTAQIPGWVEVGASGPYADETLAAPFSNYGQSVDVFAPGVGIHGPVPTKDQYAKLSGTSMAAPSFSGVAAVVRDVFPQLTADEVKRVLLASVRTYPNLMVNQPSKGPGPKTKVLFSELSKTGGIVDLLRALELASQLVSSPGGVYGGT
jgi:subtilisin family serine protease